jgi:hypothetical protein
MGAEVFMPGAVAILAIGFAVKRGAKPPPKKLEIRIEPGIDFEATYVVYHVTVRNRGDATARDVLITPRIIHGPFFLDEPPKAVPVLKPGTFGTASWRIGASGEPGELEVGARIAYWDRDGDARHEASAPPMRIDLRPPATRPVYVSPAELRERASRSLSVQDAFALPYDAERAFPVLVDALPGEGLEKIEESTHGSGREFVGQASFHGLDRHRTSYAVRVVASRQGASSTLKLLVFVQAEESLFGFYWRIRESVHRALGIPSHQP